MEIHALFAMATSNSSLLSFDDILFKILFSGSQATWKFQSQNVEVY